MSAWGGRKAQAWSAAVLREYGTACALALEGCTQVATTGDHIKPRATHPELAFDVTNGRPACLPCNKKRGARGGEANVVDNRSFFESRPSPRKLTPTVSPPAAGEKSQRRGKGRDQ